MNVPAIFKNFMPIICAGFLFSLGSAQAAMPHYSLADPGALSVVEGKITIEHSGDGHISPGSVTFTGLESNRALISVGDRFDAQSGKSYNISTWIKTIGPTRGRTQARAVITWYNRAGSETGSVVTPWAFAGYDWLEYEEAGEAPPHTAYGKSFIEIRISSLGPPPPGFKPTTFIFNHLTVSGTPTVEISTGRQCNLVFGSEPLNIKINIRDIPEAYINSSVEGVVLNYWREVVADFNLILKGGEITKTFMFSDLPRGYYQVEWNLKKNGKVERSGILSASKLPSIHARIQDKDTPWAFDSGLSSAFDRKPELTLKQGMYMTQAAGAHWLRERSGTRETAKMQQDMNVEPYYILSQAFRRCIRNANPADSSSGTLHLMEVYRGSKELTEQFGDLVKYWETWNEPDVFFFPARGEEFAAIQKAAYLGAHAGNPNVQVHNGSWSTRPYEWHTDMLKNGMNEYFDIFNLHYYETYDSDFTTAVGVTERIRKYREFFDECGIDRKPSWMTEFGYYTLKALDGTWWRSEREQAIHAVKSTCYCLAKGVNKFFIFYLQEFLENSWYVWGITRQNWTPKPAYTAYANMSYALGKGKYIGYADLGVPNSYGYVFDTGEKPVMVAWAQDESHVSIPGNKLFAVDIMGAPASPDIISEYPIFISGIDLSSLKFHPMEWKTVSYEKPDIEELATILSLRAVKEKDAPLYPRFRSRARKHPLVFIKDEPVTLELKICNFSDAAKSVDLDWTLPEGWEIANDIYKSVFASPWSEQNLRIELKPENPGTGNFYSIAVNGTSPGRNITQAFCRVQID